MVGQGIYIWANGVKARASTHEGKLIYDFPLIYPEEDFRLEYSGYFKKDGPVPHGYGTLTLKNGKLFAGNFVNGVLEEHTDEIYNEEKKWIEIKLEEEEKKC